MTVNVAAESETTWLERVFSLDLRSLAVFRIALGTMVLIDLVFRFPSRMELVSGAGFFSKQLSQTYFHNELGPHWTQLVWSVYWWADSPVFVNLWFGIAAVAAVFLIVGKWTRCATAISWLLLASLHVRNPLITSSGDFFFKMMLFWSIFLPLAGTWSWDARRVSSASKTVASIATMGYVFQLFAIYFFPGVAKWNEFWLSGDAMFFVLRLDIYITPFGHSMLGYPGILKITSWATLFAEVVWVWTLFCPWKNGWFRLSNLFLFWSFHVGIALSMSIGLFPWICMIGWLPLVPSGVWSRALSHTRIESRFRWSQLSSFALAAEMFCGIALALVVIWNVGNMGDNSTHNLKIPLVSQLGYQLALNQHFQMFGEPPQENPWFVYEALLVDGTQIDVFRNAPIDYSRPDSGLLVFPEFHWRKMHRNALHRGNAFVRQPLLDYWVGRWNAEHSESKQIVRARLLFYQEKIGPEYVADNFTSQVWGSYRDPSKSAGSLFDSLSGQEEFPF